MSRLILIDPGHGGRDPKTGHYVTAPNKMHTFEDGLTVEEGVVNREIAKYMEDFLRKEGYECKWTVSSHQNMRLWDRVKQERQLREEGWDTLFISPHNNAGGGEGMEAFSFPGSAISLRLNNSIYAGFAEALPNYPRRYSYDKVGKTEAYYVLEHTYGPAVIVECGFMDTRSDAEMMLSKKGQESYARAIVEGIKNFEEQENGK